MYINNPAKIIKVKIVKLLSLNCINALFVNLDKTKCIFVNQILDSSTGNT